MIRARKNGFSLLELLAAVAIFGVVVAATSQLMHMLQDYLRKSQQSSNRVLSIYRLTDNITKKAAFDKSLPLTPDNDKLRLCIAGGAGGGCASNCCSSTATEEFTLLDDTDTNPTLQNRRRLLGTAAKPAYYTEEGEVCDITQRTCYYKVSGTFTASCPASAVSCDKAELLQLSLKIQPASPGVLVKERVLTLEYTPDNNAQPTTLPIAAQALTLGQKIKVPVYANSGHPQEKQDFLFELCKSNAPTVVSVSCYGFINDVGTAVIEALSVGNTTIQLQINDTGSANNISSVNSFQVIVSP